MQDKLPWVDSLKINKGSAWPPIIGGMIGGLVGLILLGFYQCVAFSVINTVIMGAIIGALYGRIFFGKKLKAIVIGGIVGGVCGLNVILLGVFIFGALYYSIYLVFCNWEWSLGFSLLYGIMIWLVMAISFVILGFYNSYSIINDLDWYKQFATAVSTPIVGTLLMLIPYLNIVLGCIAGGIIGWGIYEQLQHWISMPLFAVPALSFAGYFIGCKIQQPKKAKEYIKQEIPEGGLLMSKDPAFSREVSPIGFSEKAMINDLLGALNNKSLLLTKLESWKARAKGQDQLRAFEMIREMLQRETDIIQAYTANQQARLDFENLKEFNQYLQKERLKAQLTEEKYKQVELEERLKSMKLEEEYKRLELQRRIGQLKKTQEITGSRIERLKKEELEKIDFQEEIRKVKTMRLADRVEYLHNWKKEIRGKYSPEETENIIDEFDRTMVEEGLKEE